MHTNPKPEYPRPQFERENWMNLNGTWEFEMDLSKSGRERQLYEASHLSREITVPFCPESELSGIGFKDFMPCVWYRKEIELPEQWSKGRTLLHFGAVDYHSFVYLNGTLVGEHTGGYASFQFDITRFLCSGKNIIIICAEDDNRSTKAQPRGKQSDEFYSHGCDYTRTTGIWQTVWLEYVPASYIKSVKYYPDSSNGALHLSAVLEGSGTLEVTALYEGRKMGSAAVRSSGGEAELCVRLDEIHLWEVGHGRLYDLELTYGEDKVKSYFGLRNVRLEDMKFLINEKSVFQRLVLDQGFYPDGIYTSPNEEALIRDIRLSLDAGFNGARLHQKVFEPRFLYHCDKMGYLVWGEHGNWGLDHSDRKALYSFLPEWLEIVERDFNSPAIIGWCPFNETWDIDGRKQIDDVLRIVYLATKAIDRTRPCIDTSGNYHTVTDIFDVHDYEQDTGIFKARYDRFMNENVLEDRLDSRQKYKGEPCFVSEYGGIKSEFVARGNSWGYGNAPKDEEEFLKRYEGLTTALLENSRMFGFCYTQLYDIEQEVNGLYTYDRKPKVDIGFIRAVNTKKAAIED